MASWSENTEVVQKYLNGRVGFRTRQLARPAGCSQAHRYTGDTLYVTMEYQKAVTILKSLLGKYPLDTEEKEAVMTAIGILSWGSLAKSKLKARKAKRDKSTEW